MILIDVLKLGLIIRAVAGKPATYTGLTHPAAEAAPLRGGDFLVKSLNLRVKS
jgi:hypothetical protein